ncbi:hypothetical protein THIX_60995 [Thiomonas sp. X19]|nr:hypothetical protein [Thiomonas sp. X19]SCC94937.1 hypothetical protein THIX_60995 [Thiomonas sp. X19]
MQTTFEAIAYTLATAALLAGALPLLIFFFNRQAGRKGARQR